MENRTLALSELLNGRISRAFSLVALVRRNRYKATPSPNGDRLIQVGLSRIQKFRQAFASLRRGLTKGQTPCRSFKMLHQETVPGIFAFRAHTPCHEVTATLHLVRAS